MKLAIKRTIKAPLNICPPDNNHGEREREGTSPVEEKVKTNMRTQTISVAGDKEAFVDIP
jgi:hypothetical protein